MEDQERTVLFGVGGVGGVGAALASALCCAGPLIAVATGGSGRVLPPPSSRSFLVFATFPTWSEWVL